MFEVWDSWQHVSRNYRFWYSSKVDHDLARSETAELDAQLEK